MHLLKKKVYIELGSKVIEDYYKKKHSIDAILDEVNKYPLSDDDGLSIRLEISLEEMDLLSDEDKDKIANAYLSLLTSDEVFNKEIAEEIFLRKKRFLEYLERLRFGVSAEWIQQLAEEERITLEEDIKRFSQLNLGDAAVLKTEEEKYSEGRHYLKLR